MNAIHLTKKSRLILRLTGITLLALLIFPWASSYILSTDNHNSFYDYAYLWWYYPYLGVAMGGLVVVMVLYVALSRARGD